MTVFQVFSRTLKPSGPPKKRHSRTVRRLLATLSYIRAIGIVGGAFGLTLIIVHTQLAFILLPVGVYVATSIILGRTRLREVKALLLTVCVSLLYYAVVTGWEILTHDPATAEIIVVTTTLTIAIILEPVREIVQTFFEQRFNLRHDATAVAVEAFTSTLREEIDGDQVRERFLDVVQQVMQPQSVSVWVRPATQAGAGSSSQLPELTATAENAPVQHEPTREPGNWPGPSVSSAEVAIAESDALIVFLLRQPAAAELDNLRLDSPFTSSLKAHGVEIVLPLASQGELLGLLTLGPRLDGQEYSRDDRKLLDTLAAQVAPALRVVQLVRTQAAQVRERERIEQELRTAQDIQRTFLPKDIPSLPGWQLAPYYQPAHEVGGDFYDFLTFEDGRVGLVIGDVTDKGIPAALVMTATRTMLRTAAQQNPSPREVFARVNDLLCADIPPGMFVTCFYALLDLSSGKLRYANAGHEAPYRCRAGCAAELWATGMPLGMLPGTQYDEYETELASDETLLFYSDGLVEAHSPDHEMFGFPRLKTLLEAPALETASDTAGGSSLIVSLLAALDRFTGDAWEQEDDVTLVVLRRLPGALAMDETPATASRTAIAE